MGIGYLAWYHVSYDMDDRCLTLEIYLRHKVVKRIDTVVGIMHDDNQAVYGKEGWLNTHWDQHNIWLYNAAKLYV